jgi:hypothetical protein
MAKLLATRYGYCTECHETFEYNLYEDKEDGNFTDISRGEFLVHGEHMGIGYKTEADAQVAMEREIADDLEEALSFNPNLVGWEALINCLIEEQAEATTETANTMDKEVKQMAGKQVTLTATQDATIKTLAHRHNSGFEWASVNVRRETMRVVVSLELVRSKGQRPVIVYQLTELGRDYATAHGWLAPTPAETATEAANGSQDAAPKYAVGQTVYAMVDGWVEEASVVEYATGEYQVSWVEDGVVKHTWVEMDFVYATKSEAQMKSFVDPYVTEAQPATPPSAPDERGVGDVKYNRGDLVLRGGVMYTVADEYVYRSGDELVSHYRVESKGSILDAYYLAEELTPATAIATSELDTLRAELEASRERETALRALLGRFVEYLHGYDLISIVEEYAAYDDTDQQIGAVLLRDVLRQALDASAKE